MNRPRSRRRGFALLTVMWAIGIMSAIVGGTVAFVSFQLRETAVRDKDALARDIALSGLALGLHPGVRRDDPLLREKIGPGRSCEVTVNSENARLNLNAVLLAGRSDILERLWTGWGMSFSEAQALDDCLADWIDPGDPKRLNGAKEGDYARIGRPGLPPGRPFQTLDELPLVIGFAAVEKLQPGWRNYLTLWSNGRLDLNEAAPDVIAAVCGVDATRVRSLVQDRGSNVHTDDPDAHRFGSVQEAASALGMADSDLQRAAPFLDVLTTTWRVRSIGTVDDHTHTVIAVSGRAREDGGIYRWEEF